MRKYYWILLFAVGLFSCTKVSKLSDTAEIVSFTILDQTEGIILNKDEITITNNVVTIPLDYGRKLFPLTIKADIKFSRNHIQRRIYSTNILSHLGERNPLIRENHIKR